MRVPRPKRKGAGTCPGCLWWRVLAQPSLGPRLLVVGQDTCEVGHQEAAQGCVFPAGEEQQNCFESAAGEELPFFSI